MMRRMHAEGKGVRRRKRRGMLSICLACGLLLSALPAGAQDTGQPAVQAAEAGLPAEALQPEAVQPSAEAAPEAGIPGMPEPAAAEPENSGETAWTESPAGGTDPAGQTDVYGRPEDSAGPAAPGEGNPAGTEIPGEEDSAGGEAPGEAEDGAGTEDPDTAAESGDAGEAGETEEEASEKETTEKEDREKKWEELYGSAAIAPEAYGMDFSSCRLLAGISPDALPDRDYLLSAYGDVCLLQYPDSEHAMMAWTYYSRTASFAEPDLPVFTAEEAAGAQEQLPAGAMTPEDNPLAALHREAGLLLPDSGSGVVALVDTGVSDGPAVAARISLTGDDPGDGNGHGDRMAGCILEANPDARILSVKALGADGRGTLSSVFAGVSFAAAAGVQVIALPFSAPSVTGSAALTAAVDEAAARGILVTGAAGNEGADAGMTVPGGIRSAWIAGACDAEGSPLSSSNYGDTVDCFAAAGSTSEASARLAGVLLRYGENFPAGKETGIFLPGMPPEETEATPEDITESQDAMLADAGMPSALNVVKIRENALNLSVHYVRETLELLYCVERDISSDTGTYRPANARYTLSPELRSAISYVVAHGMRKIGEMCADPKYQSGSDRVMTMAGKTFYSRDYHLTQCAIWELIRRYTGSNTYGGTIRSVMPTRTEDQRNAIAKCEMLVEDALAWAKANPGGTFVSGGPELLLPESAQADGTLTLAWNDQKGLYESEPFTVTNLQVQNVQRDGTWQKEAALPAAADIAAADGSSRIRAVQEGETAYDGTKGTTLCRLQMTEEDAAAAADAVLDVTVWQETVTTWGVHLYRHGSGQTTTLVREEAAQPVRLTLKARAEKKDTPGTDETRLVLMTGGSGRGPYALCALSLFAGAALLAGRRKRCRFSS